CNAVSIAGCEPVPPALAVGFEPSAVVLDPSTQTLYVSFTTPFGLNGVSVLDASSCNAGKTSGCTRFAPTTVAGVLPYGIALDPATRTVYVVNRDDNDVSVIDATKCNMERLDGCAQSWPTFAAGDYPRVIGIDYATDTLYVANQLGDTVSVIDAS